MKPCVAPFDWPLSDVKVAVRTAVAVNVMCSFVHEITGYSVREHTRGSKPDAQR